jgi:hypothetical protein
LVVFLLQKFEAIVHPNEVPAIVQPRLLLLEHLVPAFVTLTMFGRIFGPRVFASGILARETTLAGLNQLFFELLLRTWLCVKASA